MKTKKLSVCLTAIGCLAMVAHAEERTSFTNLDGEVQNLKKELMSLNRDLFILEEELLFPANTQVSVFVSMDVGEYFALDSVELKLNGKKVSSYLYTEREAEALLRGGVQRLFVGNLKAGDHELVAVFTGMGPNNREYRRGATLEFEKTLSPKFVELKIEDQTRNMQPEFAVREWD
ncbi:MAG: AraC family transcriptional regulator [Pseudomonadota bacterium]